MAVKTITITTEAYDKIKKLKHEDESFSKLLTKLAEEKVGIAGRFLGKAMMNPKEIAEAKETVRALRNSVSNSMKERETVFLRRKRDLGV